MSFFGGRSYSESEKLRTSSHHDNRSHSHSRAYSPARSTSHSQANGGSGYYTRPSAARSNSSFLGTSSRGIFSSGGGGGSGSSYYRRRPRDGYVSYLMHKLQRMFKELWYYARRNPVKAFFAVVVPLLSAGGAIHGLMKSSGLKMPFGLDGPAGRMGGGGGYYGSRGYGSEAGGGGGGWMDNAGSIMQIAKAFM